MIVSINVSEKSNGVNYLILPVAAIVTYGRQLPYVTGPVKIDHVSTKILPIFIVFAV